MESQGSGLPVLVADQGGPKEVVRDGETGYVLSTSNPTAWVERIVGLIADDERRARMSRTAHECVQVYSIQNSFEHFWEAHITAWHEHLATIGVKPRSAEQVPDVRAMPRVGGTQFPAVSEGQERVL